MRSLPVQRSLKHLRDQGFETAIVERWVSAPHLKGHGFRLDLFGIGDIIAVPRPKPDALEPHRWGCTLLVQTCAESTLGEHVDRLLTAEGTRLWLASCARHQLQLHAWAFRKPRNRKRGTWTLRRVIFRFENGKLQYEGETEVGNLTGGLRAGTGAGTRRHGIAAEGGLT